MRTIVPALVAGAVVLLACDRTEDGREDAATIEDAVTIEEALAEHTEAWMEIDGVEGTGIGLCDDVPCIKVFVSRPPEEFSDALPDSVEGHRVRLEPTGRFEVQ